MVLYPAFSAGLFFIQRSKNSGHQNLLPSSHTSSCFTSDVPFYTLFFVFYFMMDPKDKLSSALISLARCTLIPQTVRHLVFLLKYYF